MRVKLGFTDKELMDTSWISLCIQSGDFPYFDPKKKNVITGQKANDILSKYKKK